jgi:parvulin-like peptidyl-prolyl isomerase
MERNEASPAPAGTGKWKKRILVCISSLTVVAVCIALRSFGGREQADAQAPVSRSGAQPGRMPPPDQQPRSGSATPRAQTTGVANGTTAQAPEATSSQQPIVAAVNGEEIHRQELAQECLAQYGKEVLETVMNKYLILTYCDRVGIKVSKAEVDEEIGRLAQKFSIPVDQWLNMLKTERGIKPEQYASDIIWPTLALRKLAAGRINPTEEEIDDAYETQFGVAVKARLIVVEDAAKAKEVYQAAVKAPTADNFGLLARKYSVDPTSASLNGIIQPIRQHMGDPKIEQMAFKMKEGDISPPIEVNGQYAIIRCEGKTEASNYKKNEVRDRLEEFVRERKLRNAAGDVFAKLQKESQVVNVYNDPKLRAENPGVAATINGKTITVRELAEQCIARHGEQILDGMIGKKLLEQELKRANLKVTKADIDAEIARAASAAGYLTKDGKPNVEAWLKSVEEQGASREKYMRDSVWPSTALKLIAGDVKVSEDDIKFGYEANYGRKAQVRAIVLEDQRRAQTVWQKARENPSPDFFGKLAEQYSVEPASRSNSGHVPPIQQHGGQPALEKEVFAMRPGEISGVIQVADKYVILFLEGYTKPQQIKIEEVRNLIADDVREKKQRIAMAKKFDEIKDGARIDNFLAGTSQSPEKRIAKQQPGAPAGPQIPPEAAGDLAIPANYETTGLLPKNQANQAPPTKGPLPNPQQPRTATPRAGANPTQTR